MGNAIVANYVVIQQGEVGIVENCGEFSKIVSPGCHCMPVCSKLATNGKLSKRIQQLAVQVETKTKDNVFVLFEVAVQYVVLPGKEKDAFYTLSDVREQLRSFVFNNLRAQIPRYALDDVFLEKDRIGLDVCSELKKEMETFGYSICNVLVTDVSPDGKVKASMNEINAARRTREAAADRAEAEKIALIKTAEADAESKRLSGVGLAEQRKAVVAGLRESVKNFAETNAEISQREVMDLLLMNQYFDTLKDMTQSNRATVVFVPHTPNQVGELSSQIRDGFIQGQAVGAATGVPIRH